MMFPFSSSPQSAVVTTHIAAFGSQNKYDARSVNNNNHNHNNKSADNNYYSYKLESRRKIESRSKKKRKMSRRPSRRTDVQLYPELAKMPAILLELSSNGVCMFVYVCVCMCMYVCVCVQCCMGWACVYFLRFCFRSNELHVLWNATTQFTHTHTHTHNIHTFHSDWRSRLKGIQKLTDFVCTYPKASKSRVVRLFDAYASRLSDVNSKVNVSALKAFKTLVFELKVCDVRVSVSVCACVVGVYVRVRECVYIVFRWWVICGLSSTNTHTHTSTHTYCTHAHRNHYLLS